MMRPDDIDLLREMIADYERRADEFSEAAQRAQSRMAEDGNVGVFHSHALLVDMVSSYQRRMRHSRMKADVLKRLMEEMKEAVDG